MPLADLIDERRRLLEGLDRHPEWVTAEASLADRLRSILQPGALRLIRIDRRTPHAFLEKIVRYEAVHPFQDAHDLARRLADDRRCYAFVHPDLPDEPLIFTEVALTPAMSANVRAIVDPEAPLVARSGWRAAIFYSISSCHDGLRGVALGNALIQGVADELARTTPALTIFATLSPVPGFRSWLASLAASAPAGSTPVDALAAVEGLDRNADRRVSSGLHRQLVPLCAYYLLHVRRDGEPVDAVARFHLRNGARLERINWLSDRSAAGMRRSAGLMVNYLYRRRAPHGAFDASTSGVRAAASSRVARLAGASGLPLAPTDF